MGHDFEPDTRNFPDIFVQLFARAVVIADKA